MKKYLTLLVTLVGFTSFVSGQKFATFSDDFESYSNNAWLGQSSKDWTTWSGNHGPNGDDVQVTNSDAYSGSKSIYFNAGPGPEDVVLAFDSAVHRRGQFVYSAMMKVPAGKSAYFNFQGDAVINSTWAVEVTFEKDSTLVFDNLTSGSLMTTYYPQGKWFEVKIYVNLTRNEWHVYIDGDYRGFFSNSVNRVSFLDLYPIDNNSSFWVDDVFFVYAPPSPNNAGVELLTSPTNAICGSNDVKVRVVNNGNNALDSVRVNWSLDGVLQTPVFVKTTIDTSYSSAGNRLTVTLDSTLNLSKGIHDIKVWTSHPNGVADTLNFDDTLTTTIEAEIRGIDMVYANPYQGKKGMGTATWPDTVCVGDTITYGITPPTGYKNTDLGTGWFIKSIDFKSNGKSPNDTLSIMPSTNANFRLRYVADTSEADSIFKVDIHTSVGTNGCDTVFTRYFYVSRLPHVAFTASDACDGDLVIFTNQSSGGGNNKYLWRFGDNTSSSFQNTGKLYSSAGTYDVTLRATAPSGCRATVEQKVTVHDIPDTKFGVTDACDSSSVMFNDSSTLNNGTIARYYWEFGDGDTSVNQNATHIYKTPGTYTVRLTVTSDYGCAKKVSGKAIVHPVPDAAFSGINSCDLDSVKFNNSSSYTGTDALSYEWSFGDGNQSSRENPAHLYSLPGKYSVMMKVITTQGCADSAQVPVEVYTLPVADFDITETCLGDSTAFANTSSISTGSITDYNWNFGDGTTATTSDSEHKYATTGNYSVELVVTATGGCKDTITKDVEIFPVPKAQFTLKNTCQNVEVAYNNQSTTNSDTLKYQWSFGDGMASTDQDPVHNYAASGTYTVKIIVTDAEGCIDSTAKDIEIFPAPQAEFNVDNACMDAEVTFDNQSTTTSGTLTYQWSFGNGKTSIAESPTVTYPKDRSYDVTLIAKTQDGCSDTIKKPIEIYPLPNARFTSSHMGFGRYAFTPDDAGLAAYHWDFGDGDTSIEVTPQHKYATEEKFDVTLVATDNNGCVSETEDQVSVNTSITEAGDLTNPFAVYPNPFRDEVNIVYELQNASDVTIEVYNLSGQRIESLVSQKQSKGTYQYPFNTPEASGVYMVRMVVNGSVYYERIVKAQ